MKKYVANNAVITIILFHFLDKHDANVILF